MKKFTLMIPPAVDSFVRHLHPLIKAKIRHALDEIQRDPFTGKALRDPLAGLYTYRVTTYRIVYEIVKTLVLVQVVDIGKRKNIYRNLIRRLRGV